MWVHAAELTGVDWESLVETWPIFERTAGRRLIRVTRGESPSALLPLELPVSVLIAGELQHEGGPPGHLRHYRTVSVTKPGPPELQALCRGMRFDVMQLNGEAREEREPLFLVRPGAAIGARGLRACLRSSGTRLVILQIDEASRSAALALAHRLTPETSVVVAGGDELFNNFYRELTHDQDLQDVIRGAGLGRASPWSWEATGRR